MKIFKALLIISLLSLSALASAQADPAKRVILIGIAGVSAESFQYASTPNIDNIISRGAISLKARGVMPSQSAPNWASMLSGTGPEQNGVTSDSWSLANQGYEPTTKDEDGYFTSVFTLIRKQHPKAVTGMFYDSKWLGTCINPKLVSRQQFVEGQVMITSVALNFITRDKPVFTFINYSLPATTGTARGFGSKEYFQSINTIDAEIGKLVEGLTQARMLQNTTLIITSDHGASSPVFTSQNTGDLEVPWIIAGPGVQKNRVLESPVDLMNTAPAIARILGVKTPAEWIGRPVSEAYLVQSSKIKSNQYIPKPWCSLNEGAYTGPQQVELTVTRPEARIYYTLDGSLPTSASEKYTAPFTVRKNCTLKAVAVAGTNSSQVLTRIFAFVKGYKKADLTYKPGQGHPGLGVAGLFDGLVGSSNPANRQWMGFEGDNFEITVDLGEVKPISFMGLDLLHVPADCIILPSTVEFYISENGTDYTLLKTYYTTESDKLSPDGLVMLSKNFENLNAQYIRIRAKNSGNCPFSKTETPSKSWILVSEVEIE